MVLLENNAKQSIRILIDYFGLSTSEIRLRININKMPSVHLWGRSYPSVKIISCICKGNCLWHTCISRFDSTATVDGFTLFTLFRIRKAFLTREVQNLADKASCQQDGIFLRILSSVNDFRCLRYPAISLKQIFTVYPSCCFSHRY